MIAGLELSSFVVLAGLALAATVLVGFLTGRVRVPVRPADGRPENVVALVVTPLGRAVTPLVVIGLGFTVALAVHPVWMLVVAGAVAAVFTGGLRLLRGVHRRRGDLMVSGPSFAVLLALAALLEFHWLLVARLAVAPNPQAGLAAGLGWDALQAGTLSILVPAAGLLAVFALLRRPHLVTRGTAWLRGRSPRVRRNGPAVAIFLLFVLPLTPVLGGNGELTFLWVATPEYGKVLYLWVLAAVVATHVVSAGSGGGGRGGRQGLLDPRLTLPAGLFLLVAIASVLRFDLGPLIPVFAGTLGMSWCALRDEVDRRVPETASGGVATRVAGRVFLRDLRIPVAVILIFVVAALSTDYVRVRVEVQQDAWTYNWNSRCDPPPAGVPVPAGPDGSGVCLRNLKSAVAGERSQVAKAVAAVADGGLWGRGLLDTASRVVPLSATDFVVAALWNKLGGLVVLGFAALLLLLTAALTRAVWQLRAPGPTPPGLPPPPDRARLFAAGLVALILGQFVFVVLATLNWLPHSGITAPFLSRGGQSTLALAVGVVVAVALAYHDGRAGPVAEPPPPSPARARRPPAHGQAVVAALVVTALVTITLRPYGGYPQNRPLCPAAEPTVDPARCSTDLIAWGRTRVEVGFPDGSRFDRLPTAAGWTPRPGTALDPAVLGGLLQVPGAEQGFVEGLLPDVLTGTRATSLAQRLAPHTTGAAADGMAELTVQPELQAVAVDALSADGPDTAPPLAGGVVVLDAASGHVLTLASAPRPVAAPPAPPVHVDAKDLARFTEANPYARRTEAGAIGAPVEGDCEIKPAIEDNDADCFRYVPTGRAPVTDAAQAAENARYAGGSRGAPVDPTVVPSERTDRALQRYGLGSTFKVVIASAFLAQPGKTPDTKVYAPPNLDLGGSHAIENEPVGSCRGTDGNGMITVRQALAVSCNTAFVGIARSLGWPAVRDTALALGFQLRDAPPSATPLALGGGAATSVVPRSAVGPALGNAALGGGEVEGTPLQMAAVLATIANGGRAVQPSLVTAVRRPGSEQTVPVTGAQRQAMSPAVAAAVQTALTDVTSAAAGGTARTLAAPDGRPLYVKTGTHELAKPGESAPKGTYARQIAWVVGFFATGQGPVSFAAAVETADEKQGAARVRDIASSVIAAVVKERG